MGQATALAAELDEEQQQHAAKQHRGLAAITEMIHTASLVHDDVLDAADTRRGTRPGFSYAAKPDMAETLYFQFTHALRDLNIPVQTGQFGADMSVALTNDGPVTIWLDTDT